MLILSLTFETLCKHFMYIIWVLYKKPYEICTVIIAILFRSVPRYREVKEVVHDHTARKWENQNVNVGCVLLSITYQLLSVGDKSEMWQMHGHRPLCLWVLCRMPRKLESLDFPCNQFLTGLHLLTFCYRCSENMDESLLVRTKLWNV